MVRIHPTPPHYERAVESFNGKSMEVKVICCIVKIYKGYNFYFINEAKFNFFPEGFLPKTQMINTQDNISKSIFKKYSIIFEDFKHVFIFLLRLK